MKNIIKAVTLSLPLALGTAFADDAANPLDTVDGIVPIVDTELAAVHGGYKGYRKGGDTCKFCDLYNYAHVTQVNLSGLSAFVAQANGSSVNQNNN